MSGVAVKDDSLKAINTVKEKSNIWGKINMQQIFQMDRECG